MCVVAKSNRLQRVKEAGYHAPSICLNSSRKMQLTTSCGNAFHNLMVCAKKISDTSVLITSNGTWQLTQVSIVFCKSVIYTTVLPKIVNVVTSGLHNKSLSSVFLS